MLQCPIPCNWAILQSQTPPRKVTGPACYLMSSPYRLPIVPKYPPWLIYSCSDQFPATLHCYVSRLRYSSIPAIPSLISTLTFGRDPQKEFLFFFFSCEFQLLELNKESSTWRFFFFYTASSLFLFFLCKSDLTWAYLAV